MKTSDLHELVFLFKFLLILFYNFHGITYKMKKIVLFTLRSNAASSHNIMIRVSGPYWSQKSPHLETGHFLWPSHQSLFQRRCNTPGPSPTPPLHSGTPRYESHWHLRRQATLLADHTEGRGLLIEDLFWANLVGTPLPGCLGGCSNNHLSPLALGGSSGRNTLLPGRWRRGCYHLHCCCLKPQRPSRRRRGPPLSPRKAWHRRADLLHRLRLHVLGAAPGRGVDNKYNEDTTQRVCPVSVLSWVFAERTWDRWKLP